ncbi:MAG: trigger factor [Desulfobulbaceae bacterium]|uniref:Trigger factor n=1 Tax=Candidatus Desulfatifera sulfidica TaxID=2841691 RepID=A0A8J6N959_9BACT|nr:trigger factor [Candidatus Desulfatifera sulfidica]
MDVVVEKIAELTRKVTVTVPEELTQKNLKKAYDKLQRDAKIKGFRRGKVPRSLIVKTYKSQVEGETSEQLVQDTYFSAIEQEKIEPVVHPEISEPTFNEDGSFTYVAMVELKPEFELGEYKGIEVEKPVVEVSDEEIMTELESMRTNMAPLRSVTDRPVAMGDVVVVDFQGFYNDKALKEVRNEDMSVDIGAGKLNPEFEEKLVGMEKGQEATHDMEFPPKHPNPVLAGKNVEFRVKIKDIKERVLPEMDDEFAKDVGSEYETLDALKDALCAKNMKEKEEKAEGDYSDRIMHKLLENHDFPVPVRLVRFEVEQMVKNIEQQLEQSGMDLEAAGMNREQLAEQHQETAEKRVRGDFVLKRIAEVEDIKVKDEDLERGFARIGSQYNMPVDQVKQYFQNRDDLLPFMNELLNEKILAFLRSEVKVVDAPADPMPAASESAEG